MPVIVVFLVAFLGTLIGLGLLAPAFGANLKEERQIAGFFCTILLAAGISCIFWINLAPEYSKVVVAPIYKMDNAIVNGDKIEHQYYLGFINANGEKENVTSYFNTLDVDPSKFEAVETYREGVSGGIEWGNSRLLEVRPKVTVESK